MKRKRRPISSQAGVYPPSFTQLEACLLSHPRKRQGLKYVTPTSSPSPPRFVAMSSLRVVLGAIQPDMCL